LVGRGVDASLEQDVFDRVAADFVTEVNNAPRMRV
jgi:hypothetical protein